MIEKAYAVPHPPIIMPEIGRGEEKVVSDTIQAMEAMADEIAQTKPDTIIIASPHAPYYEDVFFLARGQGAQGDMGQYGVSIPLILAYDTELADLIAYKDSSLPIYYTEEEAQDLDHGSFIPLRFIHDKYQDFKLIRLGLSTASGKYHYRIGALVKEAVKELSRSAVFIGSGDLSHVLKEEGPYGYKEAGPIFDQKIRDIMARAAFNELFDLPQDLIQEAAQCGLGSFQMLAGALDGQDVQAQVWSYNDDFGVGYMTATFEPQGENPARSFLDVQVSPDPYVSLARQAIEAYVNKKEVIRPDPALPQNLLEEEGGCFVTIYKFDELRGCIGTILPTTDSLAEEIIKNAISAATEDPRFYEISPGELPYLEISVDVMGQLEEVEILEDLNPKTYGVMVESQGKRGLLLPDLEGLDEAEDQVKIALAKAEIPEGQPYKIYRFKVIRHE